MLTMKLNTTRNLFKVSFIHNTEDKYTECIIREETPDGRPKDVFRGTAYCHRVDQYCKKTGRKIAFTRAIQVPFTRGERRLLWEQYLDWVKV